MLDVTLEVAIQPPPLACLSQRLESPVVLKLKLNTAENGADEDIGQLWAYVTLVNEHGDPMGWSVRGTLASSICFLNDERGPDGYFVFDNLAINGLGSFRFRITLMQMSLSDRNGSHATSVGQIDTRLIAVQNRRVESWRLSKALLSIVSLMSSI
jgi:hypothetical protein